MLKLFNFLFTHNNEKCHIFSTNIDFRLYLAQSTNIQLNVKTKQETHTRTCIHHTVRQIY